MLQQQLMDIIVGPDLEPYVFMYLDDIVIVTDSIEKHLRILDEVFHGLFSANLKICWKKNKFCYSELKYLVYVSDKNGIHVDMDKVCVMLDLPQPSNIGEVRRLLRMFS